MFYHSHNPYSVLSETISFENVQQIGELITLKALRGFLAYSRQSFEKLYIGYVKDLNRLNYPTHTFSDAYDLAQTAICFLCAFIGKECLFVFEIRSRYCSNNLFAQFFIENVNNFKPFTIKHFFL